MNFPRIFASGTATHPWMIGQPANPVWTIRAGPMARQYCRTCPGRAFSASHLEVAWGRSTNFRRSNGGSSSETRPADRSRVLIAGLTSVTSVK